MCVGVCVVCVVVSISNHKAISNQHVLKRRNAEWNGIEYGTTDMKSMDGTAMVYRI